MPLTFLAQCKRLLQELLQQLVPGGGILYVQLLALPTDWSSSHGSSAGVEQAICEERSSQGSLAQGRARGKREGRRRGRLTCQLEQ